jgi:hypothetical protein
VKWFGIKNVGSAWEPKSHFVGTAAEFKLHEYIKMKEEEAMKEEKRREDTLAGKLVVAGKSFKLSATIEFPTAPTAPTAPNVPTSPTGPIC